MDQRKIACLAMDHGSRLRDRQHVSRGNPILFFSWVFRIRSRSGQPQRAPCMAQAPVSRLMPVGGLHVRFRPVACTGSAWNSNHRHCDFRSAHRAFVRKSQIAHRRQTFLRVSASLPGCRTIRPNIRSLSELRRHGFCRPFNFNQPEEAAIRAKRSTSLAVRPSTRSRHGAAAKCRECKSQAAWPRRTQ